MIDFGPEVCVHLAPGVTDMRKSFDTLAALVHEVVAEDPLSGHLFAFCNRGRDRMKVLWWDGGGYCLLAKRLESGRFAWPRSDADGSALRMAPDELAGLIGWLQRPPKRSSSWYDWKAPRGRPRAAESSRPVVRP